MFKGQKDEEKPAADWEGGAGACGGQAPGKLEGVLEAEHREGLENYTE